MIWQDILDLKLRSDTVWNRIEGSPRAIESDRALAAEIRDPLWLLARQWAFGEFQGDDAASPVEVDLTFRTLPTGNSDAGTPGLLEADVEAEPFVADLRCRIQAGLAFRDLLAAAGLQPIHDALLPQFPLTPPAPGEGMVNDPATEAMLGSLGALVVDGWAVLLDAEGDKAGLAAAGVDVDDLTPTLATVRKRLEAAYGPLDGAPFSWRREALDYQTRIAVGNDPEGLAIEDHRGGRLDWWQADLVSGPDWTDAKPIQQITLPTPIQFPGMPVPRYWELEDGRVDLGSISTARTDLARLALIEFVLGYSEDWFVSPVDAKRGDLIRIDQLRVSNTFGETFDIPQAGQDSALTWDRWTTSHPSPAGALGPAGADALLAASADRLLYLAPAAMTSTDGPDLEEVLIARDEGANKVWGIEKFVANGLGEATAVIDLVVDQVPATTALPNAPGLLHYTLMTDVARNWFPFVPVLDPPTTDLPRSRALALVPFVRLGEGGFLDGALPDGLLLAAPLDGRYRLDEEAVPRVAQRLVRRWERARRSDGSTRLWIARARQAAQPQQQSGLRFDTVAFSESSAE